MKKLTKSKNRILCGVCGGIAEYFNVDPTVVRIVWAVGTLISMGLGIIAYIICCILIPEK